MIPGSEIALGVLANGVYDVLKQGFKQGLEIYKGQSVNKEHIVSAIQQVAPGLTLDQVEAKAPQILEILASAGHLEAINSQLQGKELKIGSSGAGSFVLRDGTTTKAGGSSIDIGHGCSIQGTGNARIIQDSAGNISFHV